MSNEVLLIQSRAEHPGAKFPGIGYLSAASGFRFLDRCSDGFFEPGRDGVRAVAATGDGKVEFIAFADRSLAYVRSEMGYPAYYPVLPVAIERPIKGVLMDLDGTTVRSEGFWIWIIQKTVSDLCGDPRFELEPSDLPFVSGHSVSEHLSYCIEKYRPGARLEEARAAYFRNTHHEMERILDGRGRVGDFAPAEGVREFLLELKSRRIKIGLVTSGLYEKAYPEILAAFRTMDLGDPAAFYDCIITAGFPLRKGSLGTLGELGPKPHPWLYAEAGSVGLGIAFSQRNSLVGIEDSGAGVCSVRLAGYPTFGIAGGNIEASGTTGLCQRYCQRFSEILGEL
jgi:beta-phosphoglucomutase-like phosphatase (HAD superfamily)